MEGSWVDCVNPFYKPSHGYFKRIDFPSNQGFCPECWYRMLRMENPQTPKTIPAPIIRDRMVESKPEKDTL